MTWGKKKVIVPREGMMMRGMVWPWLFEYNYNYNCYLRGIVMAEEDERAGEDGVRGEVRRGN